MICEIICSWAQMAGPTVNHPNLWLEMDSERRTAYVLEATHMGQVMLPLMCSLCDGEIPLGGIVVWGYVQVHGHPNARYFRPAHYVCCLMPMETVYARRGGG